MAAKFIVVAMLVACAQGSAIHGADYTSFSYGVSDPHTGDVKSQHETRVGDVVHGQYSLLDSDGTKRTVDYAAGPHSGFNAIVRKDPALVHTPVVAHAAPLAYAAHAAPLAVSHSAVHAAPLAYAAHAAPLAVSHSAVHAAPLAHASLAYGYGAHGLAHGAPLAYSAGYGAHGLAHAAPLAYGYGAHGYGAHGLGYGAHGLGYGAHGLW